MNSGAIKTFRNDIYGDLQLYPQAYPNMIGLIVVAQDATPYNATEVVPEIKEAHFPVFVLSLKDIALLASRFDTAADFINLMELRVDLGQP